MLGDDIAATITPRHKDAHWLASLGMPGVCPALVPDLRHPVCLVPPDRPLARCGLPYATKGTLVCDTRLASSRDAAHVLCQVIFDGSVPADA